MVEIYAHNIKGLR